MTWLEDALGVRVRITADRWGGGLDGLAGLALRRNPRRAHLLVSRVLGKHLPVDPRVAMEAAWQLGDLVPADALLSPAGPVVMGFGETATALGHVVADRLAAATGDEDSPVSYLHSTRRSVPGLTPAVEFDEAHSHAARHLLLAADPELLRAPRPVVLVDDELSTGRTAIATIRALHAYAPHPSYTVATLLDLRSADDRDAFGALAAELGVPVRVVALLTGELDLPPDVAERAARILDGAPPPRWTPPDAHPVDSLAADWPAALPDGGRHGWGGPERSLLDAVLPPIAARLAEGLPAAARVLVLGTEELMYVPLRLAAALAGAAPDATVVHHSTTRSPVHPFDRDGYAVRAALRFPAPDDPGRDSFVYNVIPGRYDRIVVVVDGGDPAGLASALATCAPVTVVTVPSYVPAQVGVSG